MCLEFSHRYAFIDDGQSTNTFINILFSVLAREKVYGPTVGKFTAFSCILSREREHKTYILFSLFNKTVKKELQRPRPSKPIKSMDSGLLG